jgi:hypothetical protein
MFQYLLLPAVKEVLDSISSMSPCTVMKDDGHWNICHTDLSRVNHDGKTRNRKQKTDVRKCSFVNRTIQLWNELPADALGTLSCKPSNFGENVRKVIHQVK